MSLAIAVRIAGSSVRSSARRAGQPWAPAGAEVGDGVHRVGRRAAVAEREQACRRRRSARAQRRAAAPSSASRFSAERLLAQRARSPRPSSATERAHVGEHGLEVVLGLRQEGVEEARRAGVVGRARSRAARAARGARRRRARAPRARGRASRPAPGATNGSSVGRLRSPTPRPRRAKASVRQPRSRASASAARALAAVLGPERDRDVVGLGDQRQLVGSEPPSAASAERRQRPLADDHRVHELDRDVAGVRARRRRAPRARPAARRARSARPSRGSSRAMRSASAAKNALARRASAARASVVAGAGPPRRRASSHGGHRARRARRPASRATPSTPSPVRALTSMRGDAGWTASRLCRKRVEVEVEVRQQVDLVDHDQLAGAEHQRVLERLVLALGDRGDHRPARPRRPGTRPGRPGCRRSRSPAGRCRRAAATASPSGPCSRRGGTRRRSRVGVELGHGDVQRGSRSASKLPCTSPSSTPTRTPRGPAAPARAASSCPRRARSSG